ncbi:flavodoxin [Rhodococcus sp. 27YEA15]|uniref:flavodoxin family protein n=1 Tax=Rhodococcus sp. 27YEA15 TaxID=3156259 RepID=UPI003C7D42A7
MKAIIVCTSVSHGNTKKIADAIGDVLQARVVDPGQFDATELAAYDLVGFGSGIYLGSFHSQLRAFVDTLPAQPQRKAFVFATSGFPESRIHRFSGPMVDSLEQKGFEVVGGFSARAFDTFLPFKLVGGLRKGRPNDSDLESARSFAEHLRNAVGTAS